MNECASRVKEKCIVYYTHTQLHYTNTLFDG